MKISHFVTSIDIRSGGPSYSVTLLCKGVSKYISSNIITYQTEKILNNNITKDLSIEFIDSFDETVFKKKSFIFPSNSNESVTKIYTKLSNIKAIDNTNIFHIHGVWQVLLHRAAYTARKNNIPYIITPRGMLEPWIMNRRKILKQIVSLLYQKRDLKKATYIHATSIQEAENIKKLGFKTPIEIIPNGIEIENYPIKKRDNIPEKRTALFLSRIHPKKGIENLIHAWSKSSNYSKDWQLKIVGNGDKSYINSLKQLIERLNLKSVYILPPAFGDKKIEAYHKADIFILPTFSENFGIVIAEALACGTPVITTKGTPWQELEEYKCGWWIDIGVEPLVETLKVAMQMSGTELFEMGKNGRKLIEKEYSMEMVTKQMIELYKSIL